MSRSPHGSPISRSAGAILATAVLLGWTCFFVCGITVGFELDPTWARVASVSAATRTDLPWLLPSLVGVLLSLVVTKRDAPQRWMHLQAPAVIGGATLVLLALIVVDAVHTPAVVPHVFGVALLSAVLVSVALLTATQTLKLPEERNRSLRSERRRAVRTISRARTLVGDASVGSNTTSGAGWAVVRTGIALVASSALSSVSLTVVLSSAVGAIVDADYGFVAWLCGGCALWSYGATLLTWGSWLRGDGSRFDRFGVVLETAYWAGIPATFLVAVLVQSVSFTFVVGMLLAFVVPPALLLGQPPTDWLRAPRIAFVRLQEQSARGRLDGANQRLAALRAELADQSCNSQPTNFEPGRARHTQPSVQDWVRQRRDS